MGDSPGLLLTGAAGFLGRRLIDRLAGSWRIVAVDRERPMGAAANETNVHWRVLDIAEPEPLAALASELRAAGGVRAVLHLAAYYDFSGEPHPEYERTNVGGTRRLLDACEGLGVERFVFASSLAACKFPRPPAVLSERSPANGDHVYARSKRAGEELVASERRYPTAIVRFAALFSDWCEYSPLYHLLGAWTSGRWNARILGGRGRSAVPYLHVRDAALFLERLLELRFDLEPAEVLLASPNVAVSHAELHRAATAYAFGRPVPPVRVPKPLARFGIALLDALGRARGRRPFERPWMGPMIDKRLDVDARHTHARLAWAPRPRLEVLRRIPFLIENQRSQPGTWAARNEAVLHAASLPPQVRILRLFEEHEESLFARYERAIATAPDRFPHYADADRGEQEWNHRQLLRNLGLSVRTRHRGHFRTFCYDLARRRAAQGVDERELRDVLLVFERIFHEEVAEDPRAAELAAPLHDLVTRTIEFGLDGVEAAYEEAVAETGAAA